MSKNRSETFNEVAELYDASRPVYPSALIDDIVNLAELSESAKILEIGTGTGKATMPFASKGYTIHCLEPGAKLAAVAAKNLRSYPNVTIETIKFEDWQLQESVFDLAIAAQSMHWIAAETGYAKVASSLKQTGKIALFWNWSLSPNSNDEVFQQLDELYQTYFAMQLKTFEVEREKHAAELLQSGYFKNLVINEYPFSIQYNTQQYLDLVRTQSDYLILTEANQRTVDNAIANIINTDGGAIVKPYVAVLLMADKI
jgi:protein-L-isoaspartate O-methyltransferase